MIKTIIFDVGGIFINGSFDGFIKKVSSILNINIYRTSPNYKNNEDDWMRGKYTFKEFIEKISGLSVPEDKMKKLFDFWTSDYKFNDNEMISFAKKLKSKYKLVILSNADREGVKARKEDKLDFFDYKFHSFELGLIKPEKEIYEHVLKKIGNKPEECVFIDDKPENIEAAEKLGIHGILFKNKEQLEKDLKKLGVKVD